MDAVNAGGEVYLSNTRLHGRVVLRIAIGNERTTRDDVALAWDWLKREAAQPHAVVSAAVRRATASDEPRRRRSSTSTIDAVGVVVRDDAAALRAYLSGPGALWLAQDGGRSSAASCCGR